MAESNSPEGRHGRSQERVSGHVSVLLEEAIEFLALGAGAALGRVAVDCTVGAGGHSAAIAKRLGARGRLIGFDKDADALGIAHQRLEAEKANDFPQIDLRRQSFAAVADLPEASVDAMLADLGLSSLQLADPQRGFSFQAESPLDMRMDTRSERTADQVVNRFDEEQLADLIYEFGEERRSRRIARAIVRARPIRSTAHLAQVISAAARTMKHERIHPATRTFQALRIWVNRELDDLQALLEAAPRVLKPGGRLVVISFHSLEDRPVKDSFRAAAQAGQYRLLTKKPATASAEEVERNPRARSAKLRAAERV